MKPVVRNGLAAIGLVVASVVVLGSIVIGRVLTARSVQLHVEAVPSIAVDNLAIERLARSIRIPTVSRGEGLEPDFTALEELRRHLEVSFPQVRSRQISAILSSKS
jgi:hypothetical protein